MDHFVDWFSGLSDEEQVSVGRIVDLLVEHGPALPFPYSSELRPRGTDKCASCEFNIEVGPTEFSIHSIPDAAILLLGGDKTGNARRYDENVPMADSLFDEYLMELTAERGL